MRDEYSGWTSVKGVEGRKAPNFSERGGCISVMGARHPSTNFCDRRVQRLDFWDGRRERPSPNFCDERVQRLDFHYARCTIRGREPEDKEAAELVARGVELVASGWRLA